jgi:hypothetical protein
LLGVKEGKQNGCCDAGSGEGMETHDAHV